MAWSGGTFSRVHDWTTDEAAGTNIEASRMDAEDDNLATGIDSTIHKGGTNTPTANLPMGGNRHTGVGNAAARTDYPSTAQLMDNALTFWVDTGAADAYVITPSPAYSSYVNGMRIDFQVGSGNTNTTSTPTLNVNGIGAKNIRTLASANIPAGALFSLGMYSVVYDSGTDVWRLVSSHSIAVQTELASTDGNFIVGNGSNWVAESGATARTSLGVAIGTNVQAWDVNLDQIAALTPTDSYFIVGNGSAWVAETGSTVRASLQLGSIATQNASTVTITGGSVTGITDLAVADGGTGASTLTGLLQGNGTSAITGGATINNGNWSGADLSIANGGTNASTAADAATNLGLGTGNSPTFAGATLGSAVLTGPSANRLEVGGRVAFIHDDTAQTSAEIFFSTSAPTTQGSNGDIYFEHEA